MKTSESEAWCVWHEHWVELWLCLGCKATFPMCYCDAHLEFACVAVKVKETV